MSLVGVLWECNYCGKKVYPGDGTYYYLKLYHIWCVRLKKTIEKDKVMFGVDKK